MNRNDLKRVDVRIGSGRDIHIQLPAEKGSSWKPVISMASDEQMGKSEPVEKIVRSLNKNYFRIDEVVLGDVTKIADLDC